MLYKNACGCVWKQRVGVYRLWPFSFDYPFELLWSERSFIYLTDTTRVILYSMCYRLSSQVPLCTHSLIHSSMQLRPGFKTKLPRQQTRPEMAIAILCDTFRPWKQSTKTGLASIYVHSPLTLKDCSLEKSLWCCSGWLNGFFFQ